MKKDMEERCLWNCPDAHGCYPFIGPGKHRIPIKQRDKHTHTKGLGLDSWEISLGSSTQRNFSSDENEKEENK